MIPFLLNMQSKHLDFRDLQTSTNTEQELLVIGVGLGRTGTMSLRKALQILYNKPCYHMSEIITRHQDHISKWIEIFKQCQQGPIENIDPEQLKEIFKDFAMTDGNPACSVYEKLIEIYPDAKVILTTRDSQKWIESFRETIGPTIIKTKTGIWGKFIDNLILGSDFREMAILSMQCALGWDLDFADDEAVVRAYEKRNLDIQRCVPPENLLCFNVKEGWKPLCKFLNLPIPDEPFPHVNDREEMVNRLKRIERLKTFVSWCMPTLLMISLGLTITYWARI